jgi:hypothetical protein
MVNIKLCDPIDKTGKPDVFRYSRAVIDKFWADEKNNIPDKHYDSVRGIVDGWCQNVAFAYVDMPAKKLGTSLIWISFDDKKRNVTKVSGLILLPLHVAAFSHDDFYNRPDAKVGHLLKAKGVAT